MSLRFMKRKQYVPVSVPVVCLPMVQCSPFQPSLHSHFPSLQVPCSVQRGWHTRWSQPAPVQPSSQRQAPPMHTPWVPQSTEHTSRRENSSHSQPRGKAAAQQRLRSKLLPKLLLTFWGKPAFHFCLKANYIKSCFGALRYFKCLYILLVFNINAFICFKSCTALVHNSKLHGKCKLLSTHFGQMKQFL